MNPQTLINTIGGSYDLVFGSTPLLGVVLLGVLAWFMLKCGMDRGGLAFFAIMGLGIMSINGMIPPAIGMIGLVLGGVFVGTALYSWLKGGST